MRQTFGGGLMGRLLDPNQGENWIGAFTCEPDFMMFAVSQLQDRP